MKSEECDLCVIGSGAGGSLVACRAARSGLKVIILEQGPYVRAAQMTDSEPEMIPWLYKDGGLQMNSGLDMFILQGVCVGGSTVLSNMVMMRAPQKVFDEWHRLGADFDAQAIHRAYDRVEAELGARPAEAANVSRSTHRFLQGARALGFTPQTMNKALGECVGCGNCNIGCAFNTKRSALTTYVQWAEAAGARVIADTEVERLEHRRGHVSVVRARNTKTREELKVVARNVVVAAGAIGSSALLLKSRIERNVGTRMSFNAGSMMIAEFGERLDAFDADQMTSYLLGDGFIVEPTSNPIMSSALTTPGWFADHGELMKRQPHLAYAGALVATEATGRVVQSRFWGHEETIFSAPPTDLAKLKRGLRTIAEVFFAAGALRVILPTHNLRSISSTRELDAIDAIDSTRGISFGSAHPQGGNPWSDDKRLGVVDKDFAVHDFDNLFVVDASVFPSCIGVNPIDTIMAVADYASGRILARA